MPQSDLPNPLGLPEPNSLADVRAAVNEIDRTLALTLAQRAYYVRQAVRFKRDLDDPETAERRKQIIGGAVATAEPLGAPAAVVEAVFNTMLTGFRALQGETQRLLRG